MTEYRIEFVYEAFDGETSEEVEAKIRDLLDWELDVREVTFEEIN